MTLKDRESCAGKVLPSATEINAWRARKGGEVQQARDGLAAVEEKRPNDAEKDLHRKTLEAIRAKAREAATAFTDVDEMHREPTRELLAELRGNIERERKEQTKATGLLLESEKKVAELQGQLKQAQPHRPLDEIQADLDEANDACHREETLQEARALLAERIADKMHELAANVPVELGKKVTEHLQRLTGGAAGQVVLSQELAVAHIGGNGALKPWQPRQLSYGEQHQAALAVKVAVARALAETSGPVFIILDDSLVTFDPARRAATEDFLLELVSDEKLQVILLTCHTDWAADWRRRRPREVGYLELAQCARYYGATANL
jgi:DNA repair exonuclease SbcCD ATPase subunit